jgi:Lipase (class 3)
MHGARRLALISLVALAFALPGLAQTPVPDALTCPDNFKPSARDTDDMDRQRVREIAPKTGGLTYPSLYATSRYTAAAYALYEIDDTGGDANAAFNVPGLSLVGLVYGDPSRDTERRRDKTETRTLYGFVADDTKSGDRLVVLRGTQSPREWARNVQAGQRVYPPGASRRQSDARVHAGFLTIFESLEFEDAAGTRPFSSDLSGLVNDRPTVFIGHSLGSALATLAGVEAARLSPTRAGSIRILTLASPRVGNPAFADLAAAVGRIDRVCNLVDVVTAVPPSSRRIAYSHVGEVVKISPFDWPEFDNALESEGEQISCWHADAAYHYMLDPASAPRAPETCFKAE